MKAPTLLLVALLTAVPAFAQNATQKELKKGIQLAVSARYREALSVFRSLLSRRPRDPLFNYYVGLTQLQLRDVDHAVAYLEQSVALEAPFPQAYYWLAQAYLAKKDKAKATAILEEGRKKFPGNKDLEGLRRSLRGSGQTSAGPG